MNGAVEFDDLLTALRNGRLDERRRAYWEVSERAELGLGDEEALRLLGWAAQPLPPIDGFDVSSALIAAVALRPRPSQIEVVQRIYSRLPSRSARAHALDLLNGLTSREAAEAYAGLLADYDPCQALDSLALEGLSGLPRHADVIFPLLFRWAEEPRFRESVLELTLAYARAGLLGAAQLAHGAERWLVMLSDLSLVVRSSAGLRDEQWRWHEDYRSVRAVAGDVIALTGYFPDAVAETPLREALRLPDPVLRFEALQALARFGDPFALLSAGQADVLLAGLSGDLETRCRLHRWLVARGEGWRMPEALCEEPAVAAGALAERLVRHPELRALPDQLELVVTLVAGNDDGAHYYLFRFRYDSDHAAAPFGWMAGVVGPFQATEPAAGADAFAAPADRGCGGRGATPRCVETALEPWSLRTPAEHLARLRWF